MLSLDNADRQRYLPDSGRPWNGRHHCAAALRRTTFPCCSADFDRWIAKSFVELRGAGHNDVLYAAREEYRKAVREFLTLVQPQHQATR